MSDSNMFVAGMFFGVIIGILLMLCTSAYTPFGEKALLKRGIIQHNPKTGFLEYTPPICHYCNKLHHTNQACKIQGDTPTPRTEAVYAANSSKSAISALIMMYEHARQLERELAEANKQRDLLKHALERIIANNRIFTPIEWLAIAASALAAVDKQNQPTI